MSQLMNHIEYLSKEIGPRPAGTEEERQAALYITEQFQKDTGFAAAIEDFSSSSNVEAALAVLAAVTVVATVLAMVFPVLVIPAFILAAAAAVVYSLELFDKPVVSRVLSRGASQNVVAKYQPGPVEVPGEGAGRRAQRGRKIILVAHYDTGRVTPPLVERVGSFGLPVALLCVIAMAAAAFFSLLRIFVAPSGGMGLLVLNVLSIVSIVVCLLPIAKALLMRSAPYNEGATNNASGVAVLLEAARRIARGSVSEADLVDMSDGEVNIHGEAAAREAGLIPEGVQLQYEAEQLVPPSVLGDYDEEERLLSAKAAIAALTGQPVERRVYGSVADKLVNSRAAALGDGAAGVQGGFVAPEGTLSPDEVSSPDQPASTAMPDANNAYPASQLQDVPAGDAEGFENAPSWFVVAQKNAKKSERFNADEAPQIKRSRYTEAIEHAERERVELEEEMRASALRAREEEARAALSDFSAGSASVPESELATAPVQEIDPAPAPVPEPVAQSTPEFEVASESDAFADPADVSPSVGSFGQALQSPGGTTAMPAPVPAAEIRAEAEASGAMTLPAHEPTAQGRIAVSLPSIDPEPTASPEPVKSPSRSGILRSLRANIPSLSGIISPAKSGSSSDGSADRSPASRPIVAVPDVASSPVATPNSTIAPEVAQPQPVVQPTVQPAHRAAVPDLVPVASSAEVKPTPAERRSAQRPEEVPANAHAQAAPVYDPVEVPRSRSGSLINRLRKTSDEELTDTPQQWLDVDDDFEARSVGRARGSWESFRDDQYFDDDDDDFEDFSTGESARAGRRWQGGAYSSRVQMGYVDTRSSAEADEEVAVPEAPAPIEEDPAINEELEQIYRFRNPLFNTEIWFVAMGADGESHDGIRAFLEEHSGELRGSMIIEIESLGAGALSVATEEGRVRKVQASSRVKRYTRDATAVTGITPDTVKLVGTDSISSTAQKAGYQTMHLFGAEGDRPALKGSADDVFENVDETLLEEHLNFVFELLKH